MLIVFLLALVLVVSALVLVALATSPAPDGVTRSLAVLDQMTSQVGPSSELTKEAERPFSERVLEPLQERALKVGRRVSGADTAEKLRRKLELAGNPAGWNVDRVVSTKVMGAGAGLVAGLLAVLLFRPSFALAVVLVVAGGVLGFLAPNMWLYQKAYDRTAQMGRELADAIDLLTICVESGLAFDAALQQVARNTRGPLADEFARLLAEMQIGQGRADALRNLADRTNLPDLKSFVSAMVQADAFGIPIAQVLRVQSSEMRVKRRQRAEETAQKVPVKITVPLIFCILPCLFIAVLGPAALTIMDSF